MLESHETDSADLPWCYAALSSFADFLFREEDDDEVRISSYLKLTDEVEFRMRCCKEQAGGVLLIAEHKATDIFSAHRGLGFTGS